MNAVISARGGLAVLIDGDRLLLIRGDAPRQHIPIRPDDLPLFLEGLGDLRCEEDVSPDEAASLLLAAQEADQALHLALIMLDPELSPSARIEAIAVLEELFADNVVAHHLRAVLHAQPLPASADVGGALRLSEGGQKRAVAAFCEELRRLQPIIRDVRLAWEAIAPEIFGPSEGRDACHRLAIVEGLFRDLVGALDKGDGVDAFISRKLRSPAVRNSAGLTALLGSWVAPLRNRPTDPPRPDPAWSEPPGIVAPLPVEADSGDLPPPRDVSESLIDGVLRATKGLVLGASTSSQRWTRRRFRVAIAADEACGEYLPGDLESLHALGAELIDFSPLRDEVLPDGADLVLIGGGPADRYAEELSSNLSLIAALRAHVCQGRRIFSQGGGTAYLSRSLILTDRRVPGAGVLPVQRGTAPTTDTIDSRDQDADARQLARSQGDGHQGLPLGPLATCRRPGAR